MIIGRDPACDIVIDSLAIEEQHAKIELNQHRAIIYDISQNSGISVDNKKVKTAILEDRAIITLGKHDIQFRLEDLPDQDHDNDQNKGANVTEEVEELHAEKQIHGYLQVLNGANVGKAISLNRNMTNIGKAGVQTAIISKRGNGFFLSHLEGKTAPIVNHKSIGDSTYALQNGDIILIGNIKLMFSVT